MTQMLLDGAPSTRLSDAEISLYAGYVLGARRKGLVIEPLSQSVTLSRKDASRLRDAILKFRLVRERVAGWRLEARAAGVSVDEPLSFGMVARHVLTDGVEIPAGLRGAHVFADIRLAMREPVTPSAGTVDALRAIDDVSLALTTVEWILEPGDYNPFEGVATDAVSPAWVSTGPSVPVGCLAGAQLTIRRNGTVVSRASTDTAVGQFGQNLVALAGQLSTIGQHVAHGSTVLLSCTPAGVPVSPGDRIEVCLGESVVMARRFAEG
jgi:2-keto-4-pentenoate hydratase